MSGGGFAARPARPALSLAEEGVLGDAPESLSREIGQPNAEPIEFVSMCGNWLLDRDWFRPCAETWRNLIQGRVHRILSDGGLTEESCRKLADWSGNTIERLSDWRTLETELRQNYPALAVLRERCVFMRRITDLPYLLGRDARVLSFDTDVFVRTPVILPTECPDFAYCVDEVAGYTGRAALALREPLLRSLNGGFLLFRTGQIDLPRLEWLAAKYLSRLGRIWWAEQTAWGLLGGGIASAGVFSPQSVDIISGFRFLSEADRLAGRSKYFTLHRPKSTEAELRGRMDRAPIIHFAGPGKPWIRQACASEASPPVTLEILSAPRLSMAERIALFFRLSAQR